MRPPVSILMLAKDHLIYTQNTLEQLDIALTPRHPSDEILVLDNGSKDGTWDWLQEWSEELGVIPHHVDENLGFAGGNNYLAQRSAHELILLLNNDMHPAYGFVDALVAALMVEHPLEMSPDGLSVSAEVPTIDTSIGAVGAKLLYPDGRIQHMGVNNPLSTPGAPHFGIGLQDKWVMSPSEPKEVECVTGAALLTTRTWWDRFGGLDERFFPGQYEDVDYCMNITKAGGRIIYQPKAVAVHFEHKSFTSEDSQTMQTNMLKLKMKWTDDSKKPFTRR